MILGKQLCELADRECDAQPAAIALNFPIPVILAVVYPCAFFPEKREKERRRKRRKENCFLRGVNDAASAAAKPFCLLIAKHHFFLYNARWVEGRCYHHRCNGMGGYMHDYYFLKSSILFTYLAGPHSHFHLPT